MQIYPQDDKMLTVQYYNIKAELSIFGGDFEILYCELAFNFAMLKKTLRVKMAGISMAGISLPGAK